MRLMKKWLQKHVSTIGISLGGILLTLIVNFIIYPTKPKPSYSVSNPISLAAITKTTPNLKILWGDSEIKNLYQIEVLIWNDGRKVLDGNNVQNRIKPTAINYPKNIEVLDWSIIKNSKKELKFQINSHDKNARKLKLFLDPEEGLESRQAILIRGLFTIVGEYQDNSIYLTGGIKGFPEGWKQKKWPERFDEKYLSKKHQYWWYTWIEFIAYVGLLLMTVLLAYLRTILFFSRKKMNKIDVIYILLVVVQLTGCVFLLWRWYERWMFSVVFLQ